MELQESRGERLVIAVVLLVIATLTLLPSLYIFGNSEELAKNHPFGIGNGSGRRSFSSGSSMRLPEYRENRRNAHGMAMIFGVLGYVTLFYGILKLFSLSPTRGRVAAAGLFALLILVALHGFFEIFLPMAIPAWLMVAIFLLAAVFGREEPTSPSASPRRT